MTQSKPQKYLFIILSTIFLLFAYQGYFTSNHAYAETHPGDAPLKLPMAKGTFLIQSDGVYFENSGKLDKTLIDAMLKQKQSAVSTEIEKIIKDKFVRFEFEGGFYTSGGTLFGASLDHWYEMEEDAYFYMSTGSKVFTFRVPAGDTEVISESIKAIKRYEEMLVDSVYVNLMGGAYNVYSMIPSKTVALTTMLEDEKDSSGKPTGNKKFKASGSGVKITYTLRDFYHPIEGRVDLIELGNTNTSHKNYFTSKQPSLQLEQGRQTSTLIFVPNDEFLTFNREKNAKDSLYSRVDSASVLTSNGVRTFKTRFTKREVGPGSVIDGAFPLAVPKSFVLDNNGGTTYQSAKQGGYKVSEDFAFLVTNSRVYSGGGTNGRTRLGDFASFGIDPKGLALMALRVDKKGESVESPESTNPPTDENLVGPPPPPPQSDSNTKIIGVVVPLWYKEAIQNTSGTGEPLMYTGRTIKLSNDFNSKMKLDGENSELFGVDTKATGLSPIALRKFAFIPDADSTDRNDHVAVDAKPEKFDLSAEFIGDPNATYRGFLLHRNNAHISDDNSLKEWVKTPEAEALTDVDSETLLDIITGDLGLSTKKELSYEDWLRVKEIRAQLDTSFRSTIITAINVVMLIMGYMLVIYSILLMMFYWIDLFNVLVDFSLLNLATGGRLYPISTKDDLDYITYSGNENVKYVTFWHMLIVMCIGIIIGCLFIYNTPIINFITWLYFKITGTLGVV